MSKPNIIATRIDARLLHGQASLWMQSNGCNLVILADDEASTNEMQKDLMDTTVPDGVGSRYFTLKQTMDVIHKAAPEQKIFLVVRNLENCKKLIDGGVPMDEINIGNVHEGDGTHAYTSHVKLNKKEEDIIIELAKKGVKFNTKTLPGIEKGKIDIVDAIKKHRK